MMNLAQALENIKKFGKKLAEEEIVLIREHKEEAIPVLLEYVQNAVNNSGDLPENFDDFDDPLYAMFLLAEFRVTAAFEPFIKLLELDNETAEWILGDTLYDDFGAMIASVATENDIDRIKKVAENTATDEFQRVTAFNALVTLYVEGIYARDDFFAYLGYLLDNAAGDDDETTFLTFVVNACLDVYASEHFERIRQLYQDYMIDRSIVGIEDFDKALSLGETEETSRAKLKSKTHTSFVKDTVKCLSDWACFREEEHSPTPIISTGKQIINTDKTGRNDPCPCGSGKKYKKCCLYSPAKT